VREKAARWKKEKNSFLKTLDLEAKSFVTLHSLFQKEQPLANESGQIERVL
jgi:hypothetical protein